MLNNISVIATILFVFVCIASPWILNKINTRQNPLRYSNTPSNSDITVLDQPISFGYKCMWIAIKSAHSESLIKTLHLRNIKPCNWRAGIEKLYENFVFVTPPISGWTLASGYGLPHVDSREGMDYIKEILKNLSRDYGEAQFFCTHRVTEYHCWIKAVEGNIIRIYSYLGETGKNVMIEGEATEIEKSLHLVNTISEEADEENYSEHDDFTVPDEEVLMKVAENWSVNPSTLESRDDILPMLGLLGEW